MQKTYEDLIVYVLQALNDGNVYKSREIQDKVAILAKLTEEEMQEYLPSGKQLTYRNRTSWAITYLLRAGLVNRISRGVFTLSQSGKELVKNMPDKVDVNYLMKYDTFSQWVSNDNTHGEVKTDTSKLVIDETSTPEEKISDAIRIINDNLADELLTSILANSPDFFEKLVVNLLVAMGYGKMEYSKVVGGTGDDGIDGIISADKLGFEKICVQAKRYSKDNTVSNREIRNFSGALLQEGVTKGVFITTSSFSPKAINAVNSITQQKIVLIDGEELTKLMIKYNIGVSEESVFVIKKIDIDFFEE